MIGVSMLKKDKSKDFLMERLCSYGCIIVPARGGVNSEWIKNAILENMTIYSLDLTENTAEYMINKNTKKHKNMLDKSDNCSIIINVAAIQM